MNHYYLQLLLPHIDTVNAHFDYTFDCHHTTLPVLARNPSTPLVTVYKCIADQIPLTQFFHPNMPLSFWWSFCDVWPHHVDWKQLCYSHQFPVDFWHYQCRHRPRRIPWEILCLNISLDDAFWQDHRARISSNGWSSLCRTHHLSPAFWHETVQLFPDDVIWEFLSETVTDRSWVDAHLSSVCWRNLVWNTALTASFWIEHCESNGDQVDWSALCLITTLPLTFWEQYEQRYSHRWNWGRLCHHLPESFWQARLGRVDWYELSHNPRISAEFWSQHTDHIEWTALCQTKHLPVSFWEHQCRARPQCIDWANLTLNTALPPSFWKRQIEEQPEYINWTWMSTMALPFSFFKEYANLLNWSEHAFYNHAIPREAWLAHADDINVNDAVWNLSAPVEYWNHHGLHDLIPVFRESFIRSREYPLAFWEKHVNTVDDVTVYKNPHIVRQMCLRQVEDYLKLL